MSARFGSLLCFQVEGSNPSSTVAKDQLIRSFSSRFYFLKTGALWKEDREQSIPVRMGTKGILLVNEYCKTISNT